MTAKEILRDYLEKEEMEVDSLGFGELRELMDIWQEYHPVPEFTPDDFKYAIDRAMYTLLQDEAATIFWGEEYPMDVSSCRWAIEQAVINRPEGMNMTAAALSYVQNLAENLP